MTWYGRTWAYGWRGVVVLSVIIFLLTGLSPVRFIQKTILASADEIKLRQIDIFAGSCTRDAEPSDFTDGWWNEKKATGLPQVSPKGSIRKFSDDNSAFFAGGDSSLICENFSALSLDESDQPKFPEDETDIIEPTTSSTSVIVDQVASGTSDIEIDDDPGPIDVPAPETSMTESSDTAIASDTTDDLVSAPGMDEITPSVETTEDQIDTVTVDGSDSGEESPQATDAPEQDEQVVEITEPASQSVQVIEDEAGSPVVDILDGAKEISMSAFGSVSSWLDDGFAFFRKNFFGERTYAQAADGTKAKEISDLGIFKDASIKLSLADLQQAETISGAEQKLKISYAISDSLLIDASGTLVVQGSSSESFVWHDLGEISNLPAINSENGGYFTFFAPLVRSWDDAKNVKVRIEGVSNDASRSIVYIDSAWVEANYESFADKEASDARLARWNEMLQLLSDRTAFRMNERGEMKFQYTKNRFSPLEKMGSSIGLVDFWSDVRLKVQIEDMEGTLLDLPVVMMLLDGGEFTVQLPDLPREFRPGRYKMRFTIEDSSAGYLESIRLEQGFSWGVLALNADKATYAPGEEAYLQMAVLDDYGDTICDSNLTMEITAPDGGVAYLSTDNGLIQQSGQCGPNNVVSVPDYFARYGLAGAGDYGIRLIASNVNGTKTIEDKLSVADDRPLDIRRSGPTRIYPKASYAMTIDIKANSRYVGDIKEAIPGTFTIVSQETKIKPSGDDDFATTSPDFNVIDGSEGARTASWMNVDLEPGDEMEIVYVFDAPDVSPEFYLLGPLETAAMTEARQWQIASDAVGTRAKTVSFLAGTYVGSGTTGQNTNTNNSFSAFNFRLAETGVSIKSAYVVLDAKIESYLNNSGSYNATTLAFDSCQESCTANAFTGTSSVTWADSTVLAYDESESNMVRLLLDVTNEGQISSYTGNGVDMQGQFGYRFNFSTGVALNSISFAQAVLVLTYTYNATTTNQTNTVVYPLESTEDGASGSKPSFQADDCSTNSNCPLFNYKIDIPEYDSGSTRLSQWFKMYNHNYGNLANDITASVNIQGYDVNSANYVHEAALSDQANFPPFNYDSVSGYAENTDQTLEYKISSPGTPTYYLIGGEVSETYIASSSAATKTRTVSFPLSVVNNGMTAASTSAAVDVYFPENGESATGTVKIKKAWLRIKTNDYLNTLSTTSVETRVGDQATSTSVDYAFYPAATINNPSFNIIHVIASTSYAELESANSVISKKVVLETINTNSTSQGGLSAELMITYTYMSDSQGYLSSLRLFAGQSDTNGNSAAMTASTSKSVMPEAYGKTIRAAAIRANFMSSDSDGSMPGGWGYFGANLSTTTPTCSNTYLSRPDSYNGFTEFYSDVTSAMSTANNQPYNSCLANNNAADTTVGAKMSGELLYTYQWDNGRPTSSLPVAAERIDGSGNIDITISVYDRDGDNARARLDYAAGTSCDFSSPLDPTLNTSGITATTGLPVIDNGSVYQIGTTTGWIDTSLGVNNINLSWNSSANLPTGDGMYCLRLIANDGTNDQLVSATRTVMVDNVAPTNPGALTVSSKTATSAILMFGATTTETNFREYKIYYKPYDGTPVTESNTLYGSTTDANLLSQTFNGIATTSRIGGLSAATQYSFKIWAYDAYGHKSSSTQLNFYTNDYPTGVFNSASQKTDGSGRIDLSIEEDDPDNDDALRARIEYVAGSACNFATPLDPTLDETQANIQADFGTPHILNSNDYQIGDSSGWIVTSPGSNTVNLDWLSRTDLPNIDGTYCLRLTTSDGMNDQASKATTTVAVDNLDPVAAGSLSKASTTMYTITLQFGAVGSDNHFDRYKIYYKQGTASPTEADINHADTDLNDVNYSGKSTTTVVGLTPNTNYTFNIWDYDANGNKASATPVTIMTDAPITNDSLVFTNPTSGNIGIADGLTILNFRAVVSDAFGWTKLKTVTLRLADQSDNTSPFNDLSFTWTQNTNTFSDGSIDAKNAASLLASSTSNCVSNTCTLNFSVVMDYNFTATSTDYAAELYSVDDDDVIDSDSYSAFYKIRSVKVKQIHYRWRNDNGWE